MVEAKRSRVNPEAGFAHVSRLPKGPHGRALCRRCSKEVPAGRRTFCGEECIHEWKVRSNPGYAAECVFKRDVGVCVECGVDCVALLDELKRARHAERAERLGARCALFSLDVSMTGDQLLKGFEERCRAVGLALALRRLDRRLWEMDHALPVVEGGGSCGLENLRTLCWACHRRATAALAARRAAVRKRP